MGDTLACSNALCSTLLLSPVRWHYLSTH